MFDVNQITSTLRSMGDRALQQYAAMNKGDPYILSLAVSESNQRKRLRSAAQARMAAPQPKVADAAIAGMAEAAPVDAMGNVTGMASGGLPEDYGIGRLPAPNMQRMADGGIAGYGDGDDVPRQNGMSQGGMYDFAQRSEPVLRMSGGGMAGYMPGFNKTGSVNAAFEDALQNTLKYEGGFVADDAGKGPSNFGINKTANPDIDIKNLTKDKARELYKKRYWDVIGGDALAAKNPALAKVAFDTAVNLGPEKAKSIIAQAKDDPAQILKMRQAHYDNLLDANPEKFGKFEKSWSNRMADLATKIIPSAEAGTLPQPAAAPADTSLAAQIPGQSYIAPASNYDQTNSFFGRMADKMGISQEAQRNISNALNAPTPVAPVVGSVQKGFGITSLGEKLGNKLGILQGPAGRMSAAEVAALKNEQAGLRALENSQLAIKEAQGAGATLEEQEYLRKMMEANRARQVPSAAEKISDASLLREGQDVATAQRLAQTGEQAQAASRTEALANQVLPANPPAAAPVDPSKLPFKGISGNEMERMQEANQAPMTRDDIVKAAEEVTPVKERKGFSNDDLLTLGLSLLASKSPNFMTALGEAGLATVAGKKEREKTEREATKSGVELDYMKARTKEAEATAALIERGGKEKTMALEAEKMIQSHMADWMKSNEGKFAGINQDGGLAKQREEDRVRTAIYASLGLKNIMPSTSASSGVGLSASDSALINKYLR